MILKLKNLMRSDWIVLIPAAMIAFILHLLAIKGYGYFRDELYYIACSDHLAFGYVDQPPLSIWILKIVRMLFGDSLTAIRMLPILSGVAWVVLTGLIAREFGGKKFAMLLASFAALAPLGNMVIFSYYSMNFVDLIFWQILFLILIRLIKTNDPKYWIGFGIVAGFGLLNKISILFLGFGLLIGLLSTEHRKHLRSKQLWIGAGIACALFLPYIIWNATHDWAFLQFMTNAKTHKMAAVSPVAFFIGQVLYNNPINILIWIPGFIFLLFHKSAKQFRMFGWLFISIYFLLMVQQAKDYYLAAAYPVLFAGGAVLWERWMNHRSGLVFKPILIFLLFSSTLFLCPVTLAVLPVEKTVECINKLGIQGNSGEKHEIGDLPQYYADMHGWEELAKTFADVFQTLAPAEQSKCLIYMQNYGEAGAIDFFGKTYGLPKATCAHNNYWIWGPPNWDGEIAIIYGWSHEVDENLRDLNSHFRSVEHAATFSHPLCMPYENDRPIFICRNATVDYKENWEEKKHFD